MGTSHGLIDDWPARRCSGGLVDNAARVEEIRRIGMVDDRNCAMPSAPPETFGPHRHSSKVAANHAQCEARMGTAQP